MKKAILLLAGLWVFQAVYPQSGEKIDWSADLDYLAAELPERHYDFFTVKSRDYFISRLDAIKTESARLTDFQVALKAQQLIAEFGDSHTFLNFIPLADKNAVLPIKLLWVSDGLYVLNTTRGNEELLGRRIEAVNGVPVATVIDSLSTLFTVDNRALVKSEAPGFMPYTQILENFGFADNGQVELTLEQGSKYVLKPAVMERNNMVSFRADSVSFPAGNRSIFFTDRYFPEERIYYMLYNKCWSRELQLKYGDKEAAKEMPSFKDFEKKAFNTLKNEQVDKIIFDMRYNGGGNSSHGTEFIEELAKFLDTHPNIRTYVVIGRNTFSSAILNSMDFKRLTNAVFVGEETAGKPNHFGEVRSFQLPSSGLQVGYSTKYFRQTDENVNTITPDITIEASFADFAQGIDPVYEWIKQQ